MNTIEYKGKQYPVRTFKVSSPEIGGERTYTIGTDSLYEAISVDGKNEEWDTEENDIDSKIYYYMDDSFMAFSAEVIVTSCLDVPMTLIEEIFE